MNPTKLTKNGVVAENSISKQNSGEIAIDCLVGLLKNSNAVALKGVLSLIFTILDSSNQLDDPNFSLHLLSILVSNTEVQIENQLLILYLRANYIL